MGLLEKSELYSYQKTYWTTYTDFFHYIENTYLQKEKKLWFDGEGLLFLDTDSYKEEVYLFSINNILYASYLHQKNDNIKEKTFNGVVEFNPEFCESTFFKQLVNNYSKKYKKFTASVQIDLKPYDYGNEHKLVFSKADKVDLLFSHHLVYKDNTVQLDAKSSQSLEATIEWQFKVNQINAKMEKILAEKKANKK